MQCEPLTARETAQLAAVLADLRATLTEQQSLIAPSVQPVALDQQAVGRVSRIDALAGQQMSAARERQVELRLRAVTIALSRVASGDYGYCSACDEPIGFARLEARPETSLCIGCQAAVEQA